MWVSFLDAFEFLLCSCICLLIGLFDCLFIVPTKSLNSSLILTQGLPSGNRRCLEQALPGGPWQQELQGTQGSAIPSLGQKQLRDTTHNEESSSVTRWMPILWTLRLSSSSCLASSSSLSCLLHSLQFSVPRPFLKSHLRKVLIRGQPLETFT